MGEFFTGDHFDISVDPDNPRVFADDEDISEAIRSSEVSSHVSKVSNVIPVRNVLIAAQRAYIAREASADSFSGVWASWPRAAISPPWCPRTPRCACC
nr:(d)CMP kinase [Bifidobacterium longum]